MANKDFRLTAVLAVRDTMSPVLAVASQKWEGFKTAIDSTEFNDLNRKLKLAQRSVQDFASEAQGVAQAVGAPFAAVAGAVGFSLQSAVTGFAQAGDGLDKMSARLGISAVKLQEWSFAATHAGAAPEDLEDALKDLSEKIAEVAGGDTGDAAQLFSALGISVKDASGKIRPASDIFEEVADAIQRNEDPALRTKMAMVLMGDSGRKILPALTEGAEGLDKMAAEARALGIIMSDEDTAAAAKLTDDLTNLRMVISSVGRTIGSILVPTVSAMANRLQGIIVTNREAFSERFAGVAERFAEAFGKIDFERIVGGLLTIADYAIRAFNALGGFNTVLYGMGALIAGKSIMAVVSLGSSVIGLVQSFGAVASAAKAFGIVATTSMGPIGWVLGALAVGAGIIIANWDRIGPALKEVVGSVVDFVPGAFDVCKEKFGAVAGAILTTATGLFRGDFKTLFGGLDDLATASFNLLPGAWGKAAVSWYESVKASVSRIGQMIKDFFANFDFKSLMPNMDDMIPSGVKSFFGFGVDKDDDPNPKAARMERSAGFANPVSMEPDRSARMSGEMVVRVAASPGTTAQLADMSADGMKLTGNVGYSDRYAEEDSF